MIVVIKRRESPFSEGRVIHPHFDREALDFDSRLACLPFNIDLMWSIFT